MKLHLAAVWAFLSLFLATALAQEAVTLYDSGKPNAGWTFDNGREFPGATGSLSVDPEARREGRDSLKLVADFTKGGNYVQAAKAIDAVDIRELSFWVKNLSDNGITIRLVDSAGQCHQIRLQAQANPDWQRIAFPLEQFFARQGTAAAVTSVLKYEAWGGDKAGSGKWNGPAKLLVILVGKRPDQLRQTLWINNVSIVPAAPAAAASKTAPAYQNGFENDPPAWTGSATIAAGDAFKGSKALKLEKTEATLRGNVLTASPTFPVSPGNWEIGFATRTDLDSQDNSYNGTLAIEFLDRAGKLVGGATLAEPFRKTAWRAGSKQVEVPASAVAARFSARINKETIGSFFIDELSAAAIPAVQKDDRIKRMMFTTAQLGNLLFPEDPREVTLEVWSSKPLPEDQMKVSCVVRDYWGAEQAAPLSTALVAAGKKKDMFAYTGKIDMKDLALSVGRYYELHGSIERKGMEPFTNYTSFAILPEAPANSFKPEEVPFTSRNWDNRITEYVRLTHRLGIRICGVWGNMSADKSKLAAPQLDLIEKLGMGWLTGSPAHAIEQRAEGYQNLTEESLRQGVRNFIEKYGHVRPMIVNLGNEPHSKGEAAKVDVDAYRIVYDEIKKVDPTITVVGTSVGTAEDYFSAGMGKWCDAYDFHVYEDAAGVRSTVAERYPAMFKKYGNPRPVWSTELGLNSQGMSRQSVATELYKKFTNFFAAGGANVSWFGLLYPDADGSGHNSFGSAHNVFDCRYNKYAPKLDAIAYYNAVNAIAIKKFVGDKVYGDMHAFLFRDRDQRALQVWYKDKGRQDIFVPLAGVTDVQVIRIDGSRSTLSAAGKGITLTVCEDPVVLLYQDAANSLPAQPEAPAIQLGSAASSIVRGGQSGFDVALGGIAPERVTVQAPPFWQVKKAVARDEAGASVLRCTFAVPEESTIREADTTIFLNGEDGKPVGQIQYRPAVTGMTDVQLLPVPSTPEMPAAAKLMVRNNSTTRQQVSWDVMLTGEQGLKAGVFTPIAPTSAYFSKTPSGIMEIEGGQSAEVLLPMAEVDLLKVYRARATVRDPSGRTTVQERPLAAFYGVPKAASPLTIDGKLDEAAWAKAPVRRLDNADQFYAFIAKEKPKPDWKGPQDLSAEIRYLWDEQHLYVSVKVTDDIAGKLQEDSQMWFQDGLQFLIDPMRTSDRKVGKYDYALALGKKGIQTWCYLSADAGANTGEVKDMQVAVQKGTQDTGDITYEIAFPWSRLAPFKPQAGGNLGFTLIVNEDDGNNRDSFMTWFGNAHNKDVDTVGDLILLP